MLFNAAFFLSIAFPFVSPSTDFYYQKDMCFLIFLYFAVSFIFASFVAAEPKDDEK